MTYQNTREERRDRARGYLAPNVGGVDPLATAATNAANSLAVALEAFTKGPLKDYSLSSPIYEAVDRVDDAIEALRCAAKLMEV